MKNYFQKNRLRCLFASPAYNQHILNIVSALEKAGMLEAFHATFVDSYRGLFANKVRRAVELLIPPLGNILKKRKIKNIPAEKIDKDIKWEFFCFLIRKCGLGEKTYDFFWEKKEHHLDKKSSGLIKEKKFSFFIGIEHGCLFSLEAAKKEGKKTIVRFLSPHHTFFKKWVIPEYNKFPSLRTPAVKKLIDLAKKRDLRRDKEAELADIISTNSMLTTQSFIEAGYPEKKIMTVPLGAPSAVSEEELINPPLKPFRFIYAGFFSVHKGGHYLAKAWKQLNKTGAQLHIYGENYLPGNFFIEKKNNVFFHSRVLPEKLFSQFKKSGILVFPTLCDGFGMVVFEAMACGLPVITTENAGAAQFIENGKNGFIIPPADPGALEEKMLWCVENPAKVYEMRQQALKTAQNRSWADFQKEFIQKLKEKLSDGD